MRRVVCALPLLGVICGCATVESMPREIRYLPPTDSPARISEIRLPQVNRFVWEQLLDRLEQSPLNVERADQQAGLIVATYKGNPESYVDCGWIMSYGPRDLARTAGATPEATFEWLDNGEELRIRRSLELNGRMVVQVRPTGLNTLLTADSTYVLTKSLGVETPSGQPAERAYEIVSFTTGSQGRFAHGTVCQPTGELERLATSALSAGAARGSASPTTQPQEVDCTAAGAAYCEALDIIAPFREANRQQGLGLALRTVGGTILFEGDALTLDVTFPTYDSFLHVAYIQLSGLVGHILPGGGRMWPANAKHYVEETGYEIAPPYGSEMILALASEQPLFATPRPEFEAAEVFLGALRQRLADLTAEDPGTRIAAGHVLVTTEPRGSGANASF